MASALCGTLLLASGASPESMTDHLHNLFRGPVSEEREAEIDAALKGAGLDAVVVTITDSQGPRGWFASPNRGAPFDGQVERETRETLTAAGLWPPSDSRHATPGRGGSAPMGSRPKARVNVYLDTDVLQRTRLRVGQRGLSPEIERLLRQELEK